MHHAPATIRSPRLPRLAALAALGLIAAAPAAHAGPPPDYAPMVARYARQHGVPERLVHRIIMRESRYNARVISKGNYGLMQIRLGTARGMGYGGGAQGLLDPDVNMRHAVPYLANAYIVARGNEDLAVRYYAGGYYYAAKRQGMLNRLRTAHSGAARHEPEEKRQAAKEQDGKEQTTPQRAAYAATPQKAAAVAALPDAAEETAPGTSERKVQRRREEKTPERARTSRAERVASARAARGVPTPAPRPAEADSAAQPAAEPAPEAPAQMLDRVRD